MKKWGFLCLLGLIFTFIYFMGIWESTVKTFGFPYVKSQTQTGTLNENHLALKISAEQIHKGNLVLVNREHPVHPDGIPTDVINLYESNESKIKKGYGLLNSHISLSMNLAQQFSNMVVDAAETKGIDDFIITSGFRQLKEQSELYQEKGSEYALPAGHSEHNLGLALDVGSTKASMYEAAEAKWMKENAWEYGFVLRYPKDKVEVTGINYEPWHIRYVGLPHSAIMKEKNYVLEEYLDYLKKNKRVSIKLNGITYSISYYPYSKNMTIPIPENMTYVLSGNNTDGVILTVY